MWQAHRVLRDSDAKWNLKLLVGFLRVSCIKMLKNWKILVCQPQPGMRLVKMNLQGEQAGF